MIKKRYLAEKVAEQEDLMKVPDIGPKTASQIREIVGSMYKG